MSWPLFEHLDGVAWRLAANRQVVLFLDFDGTLAPIVERPELAHLPPETRALLHQLARQPGVTVSIISGRSLPDIQARVSLDALIYAGNHGLEIGGPGLHFVQPEAALQRPALQRLAGALATQLRHFTGVAVEDKGLSLSIHVRRAQPADHNKIARLVQASLAAFPGLALAAGKMVLEIRPAVAWNKGSAVGWISAALAKKQALAICLGDDRTDEDAFAALPEGITIKVGPAEASAARYHLNGPAEVRFFLAWLARALEGHISG
ncbi:MAG: Trehalose-phosphate phosphatase [bacterium]|nr:Trehalose-phosphate phosphatase [bacterium]